MDRKLFNELTTSLKQAGAITRDERKPSREFAHPLRRIRAARKKTTLWQAQSAKMLPVSMKTRKD